MPDQRNKDYGGRGGSLLSLGTAGRHQRSGASTASLLDTNGETNQALQHRLARSRREARPNPLLHALAARPDPERSADSEIDETVSAGLREDFGRGGHDRNQSRNMVDGNRSPRDGDEIRYGDHRLAGYEYDRQDPHPLIDPLKFINGIRRSKRLIAATTIAGALISVMIALATPKQYEAVGEVLVDPRDIRLVDRELVNTNVSPNTAIAIVENQVRIMTSSRVAGKVVDRLNLDTDPEFNGSSSGLGIPNVVGLLRSLLVRRDGPSGPGRSHAIAVQTLLQSLEVTRSGKTFVVTVGVTSESADKSALIANTVIDVFMEDSGEFLSSAAGRAANELGAKLAELRAGVEEAERKVEEFKGEKDLIDARGYLVGDDEIIKINEQLAIARARTIELSAKAASARSLDINSAIGGALPEGVSSSLITELRTQYADLRRQASQVAIKFGAKHPQNQAIQAQLEGAREQLRSELRRIVASMQIELRRAVELEQKLAARFAALKARQVNISDDMVTLRELERESAAKRAVYESYLLRARETGEQKDLNSANLSVISSAAAPLEPVGPSRSMISIAGTVAGFLLGVGLAGLRGATEGMFGGGSPSGPHNPGPNRRPTPPGRPNDYRGQQQPDHPDDRSRMAGAAEQAGGVTAIDGQSDHQDMKMAEPQPAAAAVPPPANATPHPAAYSHPPAYTPFGSFGGPAYPSVYPVPYPIASPMPVYAAPVYQPMPYPQHAHPHMMTGGYPPHAPQIATPPQPAAPPAETPFPAREAEPQHPIPARYAKLDNRVHKSQVNNIRDDLRDISNTIYNLAERRSRRRA